MSIIAPIVTGVLAAMAACSVLVLAWIAWCEITRFLGRRRKRLPRAEKRARWLLNMAPEHPERITGGEKDAVTGSFAAWGGELTEDGLDAGTIIADYRRRGQL